MFTKKVWLQTSEGITTQTRSFSTYTRSLISLRDWLLKHGITHVVMESTGVYWKPIYNILGDHFKIMLVNPRHVKNVPGRKTDMNDSQWLAKLLVAGLLKGSFIPTRNIRELRDLVRYKTKLTQQVGADKNRLIKTLEDANIKLSSVLTDVFGVTVKRSFGILLLAITNRKSFCITHTAKYKKAGKRSKKPLPGM